MINQEDVLMELGAIIGVALVLVLWLFVSAIDNKTRLEYAQTHYCVPIADKITEDER